MSIKFKEVKELPNYERSSEGKSTELVLDFQKSGIGIADVTEHCPKNKRGVPVSNNIKYAIHRLGLRSELFVTVRRKNAYFVNIKKTGIRYCDPRRKLKLSGRAGWKNNKVKGE